MKNRIENLKQYFKKNFNGRDVIVDIETIDFNTENKTKKLIYNIGILNTKKVGISLTIKETLEIIIKNRNNCKNLKIYYNNLESSYLLSNKYIKTLFEQTQFKKLIGYNIVNFDYPILSENYQLHFEKLIDLYYLSSFALPKKYIEWCLTHNLLTEKKNPQFNAESVYKFIKHDLNFKERHTALYDCLIELEIYNYCKKRVKLIENKEKFNFQHVWKNYIKRFKTLFYPYDSYFKKLILQEV